MPDLLAWLVSVVGHWQHLAGGVLLGSAVTGTVIGLEVLFHRTVSVRNALILFFLCFSADVGFMAWQDQLPPVTAVDTVSPVTVAPVPVSSPPIPLTAIPPAPGATLDDEAFSKSRALLLSNDIMRFYVSRDVMQPRALSTGAPGTPEWNAVEDVRAAYKRETISEFQARFGVDLLRLTDRLQELHLNTGGVEVMYRELQDPLFIRTIATQLSSISK